MRAVRHRDHEGSARLGAIGARIGVMQGWRCLGVVPVMGVLVGLASLVNYLWPLWGRKNQAPHDKVAGTIVVRRRAW